MNQKFCKFFKNGLVYNNNATNFTISPCCYFSKNYVIAPTDVTSQLGHHRLAWQIEDTDKTCQICKHQELSNIPSYRQTANNLVTENTDKIVMLTVAVNKKCNLACPTCGSHSSSLWHRENVRNGIKDSIDIIDLHKDDHKHIITRKFLSLIESQDLSELKYIKFGGGEPLMSDTHLQILNMIQNPEQVIVQYTSNFSIMPSEKIFNIWQRFKLIKWCASIDGINERFEFLRWPYTWDKFNKFKNQAFNIVPNNVIFGVEHTINPLNILYFDEFKEWFDNEFAYNRLGDPSDFNIHYADGVMGLNCTTPALKQEIISKLGVDHQMTKLLNQIELHGDTDKFIEYLNTINTWRNQDWKTTFSKVAEFY